MSFSNRCLVPGVWCLTPDTRHQSMCWLSLQEHTATQCAYELAIPRLHLPTHRDDGGAALLLPAFVRVVVDLRVTARLRECPAIARIVDDQIGVAAELDRAFPGVEPEEFRGLGRAGIDHRRESQPARADAKCMDQVYPFLHRGDAVGDLRERLPAHLFLVLESERRMIGVDRADVPCFT